MKLLADTLPELTAAVARAAELADAIPGTLEIYEHRGAHYTSYGYRTACARTAQFVAGWCDRRKLGRTDYGRPMRVDAFERAGAYDVRIVLYSE